MNEAMKGFEWSQQGVWMKPWRDMNEAMKGYEWSLESHAANHLKKGALEGEGLTQRGVAGAARMTRSTPIRIVYSQELQDKALFEITRFVEKEPGITGPESRNQLSDSKETKRDFLVFCRETQKWPKKDFRPPKWLKSDFLGPKKSYLWSLLSRFAESRESFF